MAIVTVIVEVVVVAAVFNNVIVLPTLALVTHHPGASTSGFRRPSDVGPLDEKPATVDLHRREVMVAEMHDLMRF